MSNLNHFELYIASAVKAKQITKIQVAVDCLINLYGFKSAKDVINNYNLHSLGITIKEPKNG